ncbi:MAG: hypothetical protein Fur0028_08420 [Bacteroidales bacterium]
MKDLFGHKITTKSVKVNIYADEIQSVECPYTGEEWFYIGIIVECVEKPLLGDIINARYCGNFDKDSPYFAKNDRLIHWSEINDIDTKNIAKRWIEYIMNSDKSKDKFYAYVLGINNSKLDSSLFDMEDEFNSKYNRFFRSAVLYALKSFFSNSNIIVMNIYHEVGQQEHHEYFPWHVIYKIKKEENVEVRVNEIVFLPKSHREDKKSNIIQLCDLFLGLCKSMLHGMEENSKAFKYKKELLDLFLPLFERMIEEPANRNSRYAHASRIMIRFFPEKKRYHCNNFVPEFYTKRPIKYKDDMSDQLCFDY